jgi:ATP phosphoribosyltransferase
MANVSSDKLERVIEILPGLKAPTIMELSEKGMYAIHAVVDGDHLNSLLASLKRAGASGILVLPIERMVP